MARRLACVLCAALCWMSGSVGAQQNPLQFLNTAADGSLTYTVPAAIDLPLLFTAPKGRRLELYLSPFMGEQGDMLSLRPAIAEIPKASAGGQHLTFETIQGLLTLRLQGPALPTAGRYTGTLGVLDNGTLVQSSRIVLTRVPAAHSAKLALDPKSIAVYQRLTPRSTGAFTLQLRNADANWPAEGVFLRLVEVTTPSGVNFDPARNLRLTWNGSAAADLWRSPAAGSTRSIAPSQQAEIGGRVVGLPAGEYTVKIGVGSANAAADAEQQVSLKVYVKHRWEWALAVLLLAIAISYIATKGLEAQRRRAAQLEKIAAIRPAWLREEPATLPTVAARAILGQVEARNRKWRDALLGQDVNKALIDRAELLLRILERVQRLQSRQKSAAWDLMVTNRFNKRLAAVLGALDPQNVNEDKAKQIESELGVLEQWFDPAKLDELYWLALKGDMAALKAQVKPEAFVAKHRPLADRLYDTVEKALEKPPSGTALYRAEEKYAQLKVLWERQQEGDAAALDELVAALTAEPDMSIRDFFRTADGIAWQALKGAPIELVKPAPTYGKKEVDPLHAYDLILFEIAPQQPALGRNYLFKHGIEYTWTLDFKKKGESEAKQLARRRTMEPRLVQFVPDEGTLYLSVILQLDGDRTKPVDLGERSIQKSADYGWRSAFRFNELAALGIATLFAAISGLATYYFGKPAFGAIGDYIALFIWGAGVDQTKNFVQNLDKTRQG